ncbi:MAG: hypothetical protein M3Q75_06590 [Gemmatimonadota bacterium]|nr:hypothetical protein [Gemmatimonadota bacterium]
MSADQDQDQAQPEGDARENTQTFSQWMHRLRNEVNTATMAVAAADVLLQVGEIDQARTNLQRAQQAGRRCAAMLADQPAPS